MQPGNTVATRYITALIDGLDSTEALTLLTQAHDSLSAWVTVPELMTVLNVSHSPHSAKVAIIDDLLAGYQSTQHANRLSQFFKLLSANNRLGNSMSIIQAIANKRDNLNNTQQVVITTAHPVTKTTEKQLEKIASAQSGDAKIVSQFIIDESLIGGFKILINNRLIDGSLSRNLERLTQSFV